MNANRHPSSNRTARLLAVPAIAAAGLVAASPSANATEQVPLTCGAIVTTDVRLAADLLDCPGAGLVVGASDITIDLAGHVIDGQGAGAGIDNGAGYDNVLVARGTVRQFLFGVHLFDTSGGGIHRLAAESNSIGVIVERSVGIELDRVTATDNIDSGIEVTFSDRVAVRRSTAANNGQGGIVDRASTRTTYERNTVTGNVGPGLDLWFSDRVVVERNRVAANDSTGIQLVGLEDAVVERNTALANGEHGISIDRPGNTVTRNEADDNHGVGIDAPAGTIDGGRNSATGNLGGDCTGVLCQ